jgi:hypothetical protein
MRTLSVLALAVAAFSIACGTQSSTAEVAQAGPGNSFETKQALINVEGVGNDAFIVAPISIDISDSGCSVDGIRFSACSIAREASDIPGPADLCELETGMETAYFVECGIEDLQEIAPEIPAHCPEGHEFPG